MEFISLEYNGITWGVACDVSRVFYAITLMELVRELAGIWKFPIVLSIVDACPTGNVINYGYR